MKVFLTGQPGIGKTSLCLRLIELLRMRGFSCGGIVSQEVREGGARTGFEFIDVETGKRFELSSTRGTGPKVGRYCVNLSGIKEAVKVLKSTNADVIFVDELGPMELKSDEFKKAVDELINSNRNLVVVVHRKLAQKYKCIQITKSNRDALPTELASRFSP